MPNPHSTEPDNDSQKQFGSERKVTRDAVVAVFAKFVGQQNTLVLPRALIDLCEGDHIAALLLSQILYWSERTRDPDGWFAKSAPEWERELGLSKYQVSRLIQGSKRTNQRVGLLNKLGVEKKVAKSRFHQGQPVAHYRVDWEIIQHAIYQTLDLTPLDTGFPPAKSTDSPEVKELNSPEVKKLDSLKADNVDSPKPDKPDSPTRARVFSETTAESKTETTDTDSAPPGGAASGHNPAVAINELLASYREEATGNMVPGDRIFKNKTMREAAATLLQNGVTPAILRAFIRDRRQDDFWADKPITMEHIGQSIGAWLGKRRPDGIQKFRDYSDIDDAGLQNDIRREEATPHPRHVEALENWPQEAQNWETTLIQLEIQLDDASFYTWVRDTVFLGCEADEGDEGESLLFIIGARNTYAAEHLQHGLYRAIRRVLRDVHGGEVELRFEVLPPDSQ